jgi:transposase
MCEIVDFTEFNKPKRLCDSFGIDPSVKESEKFKVTRIPMPKRGQNIARRVLFTIALISIRGSKSENPNIPAIYKYYKNKK